MGPISMSYGQCCVCGASGEAVCSRCRAVTYCGPDCQRADWKRHNLQCGKSDATSSTAAAHPVEAGTKESAQPIFARGSGKSASGVPGEKASIDVYLVGHKSVEIAQRVVDILRERGVCVLKAGADKSFQRALMIESKLLWDSGEFGEAKKGRPDSVSGEVKYDSRDDRILWMTNEWTDRNEKKCKALKVLDGQLKDFGWGINNLLEEQLGVGLKARTPGMLACYAGDVVPGARYDFHVDNPYQTSMRSNDDKRRLTLIYYINDGEWDVKKDGGALQVCLSNPRRAPQSTAEALQYDKLTISPESDTLVAFWSHTMFHAVLPVVGNKRRFALSTWFQCQ